jgi:hypothetical protein
MLRQTLVRSLPRRSVLPSSAAPAALMASMTTLRTTAAVVASSSQTTFGRPSSAAAGSLRLYSLDVIRRTDFADKGPITYDEVKELTETRGVRRLSPPPVAPRRRAPVATPPHLMSTTHERPLLTAFAEGLHH